MKSNLKLFSVLFVAAFAMLLTGCKDSPVSVAKKWHSAAIKDGDKGKALDCVSGAKMESMTKALVEAVKSENSYAFGDAKIDGDTATVKVTYKKGDDKVKFDYELEKEDGRWLISKIKEVK